MDWNIIHEDLKKRNWRILFILSSFSYFFLGNTVTLGIIIGGFTIIANFKIFQHTICAAFSPGGVIIRKNASIIAKYCSRFLALGAVMYLVIRNGLVDPTGLCIGLSTVVISIITLGISRAFTGSAGEAP